jgi:hypothetical protein
MHFRVHQVVPRVHTHLYLLSRFTLFQFQFVRIKSTNCIHNNSSWMLRVIPIPKNFLFLFCSPVFVNVEFLGTLAFRESMTAFFLSKP